MRPDSEAAFLWDMRRYARDARSFVAGMSFEQFQSNRLVHRAVERAVEVVGEAATHISPEYRALHPEIPWHAIIAQRNVLIHAYPDIRFEELWGVVEDDLPELLIQFGSAAPGGSCPLELSPIRARYKRLERHDVQQVVVA
jgi:uncharacterized protein with HEPN domain